MGSYLLENVYAVCLNQLGTNYRQLQLSDDRSGENSLKTVKLGSESRVFLVKLDKKLSDDFTCKSGWSSGAGTAAVGVGVVAGMAATVGIGVVASGLTVAAAVATVPVAGWIAGGIIAIGCIGYGLWQMMKSPTCSEMIGFEESHWVMHHNTVRFDSSKVKMKNKFLALTKNSKLICKEPGGVLLPFISETLAKQAAEAIGNSNQIELGINVGAGLFSGFLLGFGLGGAGAATGAGLTLGGVNISAASLSAISQSLAFGGWTLAGHYVINPYIINPATNFTSDSIAQVEGTTKSYDELKQITNPKPSQWETLPDPTESNDTLQTLYEVRGRMVQNGASQQHIAEINSAIQSAQNAGTFRAASVPEVNEVLQNVKKGRYGNEIRDMFTNKSGNLRGMNREANYRKATNNRQQNIDRNRTANRKAIGFGVVQLLFPFISSYFGNEAIRLAAEISEQDATNSVSVNSLYF